MRQKLEQYIGLVNTAEDSSAEMKTTPEDLQVCIGILYCSFVMCGVRSILTLDSLQFDYNLNAGNVRQNSSFDL